MDIAFSGKLLKEQREVNDTYLNDIREQAAVEPDYRYITEVEKKKAKKEYEAEKKRAKEYNKSLKHAWKTELPSFYEPLVVNCELLFALADKMNLTGTEKADIEAILKTSEEETFLVKPINDAYSFTRRGSTYSIDFSKDGMIIPVNLLTADSKITVTVSDHCATRTFENCKVTKVDRGGKTIDTFKAYVSSKALKKYEDSAPYGKWGMELMFMNSKKFDDSILIRKRCHFVLLTNGIYFFIINFEKANISSWHLQQVHYLL